MFSPTIWITGQMGFGIQIGSSSLWLMTSYKKAHQFGGHTIFLVANLKQQNIGS